MRPGDPHNRQYQPHKQNKLQRQREEHPASIANKDEILCRKSEDPELMREPLKANHLHVAERKIELVIIIIIALIVTLAITCISIILSNLKYSSHHSEKLKSMFVSPLLLLVQL